jgi:hypothetical protein
MLIRRLSLLALALGAALITAAPARAQSQTVTYQGELTTNAQPANGLYDFWFEVYDAPVGGLSQTGFVCMDNVQVTDGRFTVPLTLTSQLPWAIFRSNADLWVEVRVRPDTGVGCGNAGGLQLLSPRQPLTRAPHANHALTASALTAPDGLPTNVVNVDNAGNVGIGTTTPQGVFDVSHGVNRYMRLDSFNNLRLSAGTSAVIQMHADMAGTGIQAFFVNGGNPMNLGPNGVGLNGASPPASGLTVNGPITHTTQTRYITLHGCAFAPPRVSPTAAQMPNRVDVSPTGITAEPWSSSQFDYYMAPLTLPHGATITNITATVVDNSTVSNIRVDLSRTNIFDASVGTLATMQSAGNSAAVQTLSNSAIGTPVVDNLNHAYWVGAVLWSTNLGEAKLVAVRVTYTVSQPLP